MVNFSRPQFFLSGLNEQGSDIFSGAMPSLSGFTEQGRDGGGGISQGSDILAMSILVISILHFKT